MYYLEDLTLQDIKFLSKLLEDYRETNTMFEDGLPLPLPHAYHIFKEKVKRLTKYVAYNPFEADTPKKASKYSEVKKKRKNLFLKEKGTTLLNELLEKENFKKTYRIKKDIR
jgi:hypothetical protein